MKNCIWFDWRRPTPFLIALLIFTSLGGLIAEARNVNNRDPSRTLDVSTAHSTSPLSALPESHHLPTTSSAGPLMNAGFEAGCDPDIGVGCKKDVNSDVYNGDGIYSHSAAIGEIFTPDNWTVFFKQGLPTGGIPWDPPNDVGYAQPEAHVIRKEVPFLDPPRIHSGEWAVKAFTFFKIHDAGLYQRVSVTPGSRWRLSAWVHAWTSCEDDPYHSECEVPGPFDPEQADQMVGLDPTGGTNPYAPSVVWSTPAHIYDVYTQTHAVEVTAGSNTLTVFLRSRVKWRYKHNDMYWDTVTLEQAPLTHHAYLPFVRQEPYDYWPSVWVYLPAVAGQTPIAPPPPTSGGAEFGLVFVNPAEPGAPVDEGRYQKAADLGIGWDRWPLYWYNVERFNAGEFDWSVYDPVVEAELSHGLQSNPILMGTPVFYATGGLQGPSPPLGFRTQRAFSLLSSASPPTRLYEPVFADGNDLPAAGKTINPNNPWASFVYRTVERYRPGGVLAAQKGWPAHWGVRVWEVWNEPDLSLFWHGSIADYARLLKVAALAARQADAEAVIMTGGLAEPPVTDSGYLSALLAQLAQDPHPALRDSQGWYFDAVALHNYGWSWHTGERIREARQLIGDYGKLYPALGDKPIWVNESGVPVWNDYPGPTWQSNGEATNMATMEEQAAFMIQNAAYAAYEGAATVFQFQLYDGCGNDLAGTDFPPADPPNQRPALCDQGQICASASAFGLWRNKPTDSCYRQHPQPDTARPAYSAFRAAVQTLTGAQPLSHQQPGGDQEWLAFYRPDTRQRVIVLWARYHRDAVAQVAAIDSHATLIDQSGASTLLTPSNGVYTLVLPAATNLNQPHPPDDTASIGGRPFILVENWNWSVR